MCKVSVDLPGLANTCHFKTASMHVFEENKFVLFCEHPNIAFCVKKYPLWQL